MLLLISTLLDLRIWLVFFILGRDSDAMSNVNTISDVTLCYSCNLSSSYESVLKVNDADDDDEGFP